ncbi:FAD/NAD(P)-binding protein [Nocardioides nitrophenolicus]|uniref:FAD/NAD(P)-binding protein n=1 Tax=Nocardioides nitrophenolicus TaxID=60489 RepID=UPI001EF99888|nr:FAD/NAD(P)-binding protein [Nocardioides nitrophenolicus]MBM7516664.1 putative NAD(P)/FAD-binding protein YdhS [Nocardioides nitrophenolicus]
MTATSTPTTPRTRTRVAVIGGGASGVLTAINLLVRSDDPGLEVVVHEASGIVGRGIAYGTNDQRHLLNVRARHMSAFPDAPSDLLDWALRTGRSNDPQGFLPRADYAIYLQDRLADVADDRLRIRAGRVLDVVPTATGFEVVTERSTSNADAVVLCHGNQPPRPLATAAGVAFPDAPWHVANPWELARLRTLPADARVIVVGTGLTGIDTAITLLEDGPERHVTLVSRNGLLPKPHVGQAHTAWVTKVPDDAVTADDIAAAVADECRAAGERGVGWRAVVDGLRPLTQELWRRLSVAERRRFLEVHARDWEVRRHRMAPEVALRLQSYRYDGRLAVQAGSLHAVEDLGERCRVTTAPGQAPIEVDAVVNCTGPLADVRRSTDPLLKALVARGTVAPDPLALGIDSTPDGGVVSADGRVVDGLFVVGPPRKGTLWESTAIPEIRGQAAQVAAAVLERTSRPVVVN